MAEVNSRVELEEVLALGVDRAAAVLDAAVAVMTFRSGSGWVVASGFPGETSYRDALPNDTPETVLRAGGGGPMLSDLREERWAAPTRAWAERHGLGPYIGVPLRSAGVVMGVIGVMRLAEAPTFSEQDSLLLQLVASPLAAAVHVAQLFEQMRAGSRQLETLLASTDTLWRIAPFSEVAESVARQAIEIVPGTECLISMVPPERPSHFRMVAGAGSWALTLVGREWPWLGTVAGSAMSESRTIESTRLRAESSLSEVLEPNGIDTGRLIPLITGKELPDGRTAMGVLGFYRTGSEPFTTEQRSLMDEFGKRVSLTLHRAELLDSATRSNDRLKTGLELTLELASALDYREVIRRLLRRAVESVAADRASLALVEGSEMIVEDGYDRDGSPIPIGGRYTIPLGSPTDRAVRTGRPKVGEGFDSTRLDAQSRQAHAGTRHVAIIPLALGGKVGAILMLTRRTDSPFARADIELLQLIGNAAAVALRNASLYGEAHDLSRTKSDFMNLAAHELRTPLSVISGYVSMLQDGTFGPGPALWAHPLSVLAAKTGELGGLVEDLLVAARLEAGTMPTAVSDFDLRNSVRDSLARSEPRAALLGAELLAELPAEPVLVRADPDHVARILDNLINNALTYTADKPWVRVAVAPGPPREITVTDRGLGIPEAHWEKVFERFYRVDHLELPRQAGTGLGLAISRELAERHGGSLDLLPTETGSCFRVLLPLPDEEVGGEQGHRGD
ncbi:MAG: GAF domain-containing protein [Candidatus Dormibacteraeota bacterium]|nr:GAF domain-containing protein [Candidatus Dormibacteraeota bacterium]